MLNLLTATLDTDFRLIGEAVTAGAKAMTALTKALGGIEEKSKATVMSGVQAALDALESSADVLAPSSEKSDEAGFLVLVEMDAGKAKKSLRAALVAVEKEDWDTVKKMVALVTKALGASDHDEEPKEEESDPVEEGEFSESLFGAVEFEEADNGNPLMMKVKIIQPGWGNSKDNNYYGREMLKEHAGMFVGAKMFETDHKAKETNNRTWVSTITAHDGYTDSGAPVFEVLAHAPDFIQRVQNLQTGNLLEKLECSIRALGMTRRGTVDGKDGNIVEAITSVKSVDWVSKAGAGGHAVDAEPLTEGSRTEPLTETESLTETETAPVTETLVPPVITYLPEATVEELLGAATLPKVVKARLSERDFLDQQAVLDAVTEERAYLREATGSGSVSDMGSSTSEESHVSTMTLEEVNARRDKVNQKWLGGR